MSSSTALASTSTESAAARHAFARFLRTRGNGHGAPLRVLIAESGIGISVPAAYRVAVRLGLRGLHRSSTRYTQFWAALNWRLPDADLSDIWGTSRGNIRQRRVLIGAGRPRWHRVYDRCSVGYRAALVRERLKAQAFTGPRPR